jgi:hypothetical protein
MQTKTLSLTRILLLCGAIAGPLFINPSIFGDSQLELWRGANGPRRGTISTFCRLS